MQQQAKVIRQRLHRMTPRIPQAWLCCPRQDSGDGICEDGLWWRDGRRLCDLQATRLDLRSSPGLKQRHRNENYCYNDCANTTGRVRKQMIFILDLLLPSHLSTSDDLSKFTGIGVPRQPTMVPWFNHSTIVVHLPWYNHGCTTIVVLGCVLPWY